MAQVAHGMIAMSRRATRAIVASFVQLGVGLLD